jgi:ABC-type Fe3+ transport system permease subunit
MTTGLGMTMEERARQAAPRATMEKVAWTIAAWSLFAILVLGPLATVLVFSFTPSVFEGARPTTGHWYRVIFSEPQYYAPLIRSLEVALIVVLIQLVFGTFIAYATVRGRVFAASWLDALSNITIALPSVVVGLALVAFYGPFGPVTTFTDFLFASPLSLTFTLAILVLAHVLETFPYMVRSVTSGLLRLDPHLESAGRSLGASRWYVFRTITLPQLRPSLVAGSVLVLSRSIAEFGATIIVVSAVLRTAPVRIYSEAETGSLELAAAYSVILMLVSFTAYLVMRRWLLKDEAAVARG